MDRNEETLTYIEAEPVQNTEMKYRDMYVQGQDVYYDLPRYLNYWYHGRIFLPVWK